MVHGGRRGSVKSPFSVILPKIIFKTQPPGPQGARGLSFENYFWHHFSMIGPDGFYCYHIADTIFCCLYLFLAKFDYLPRFFPSFSIFSQIFPIFDFPIFFILSPPTLYSFSPAWGGGANPPPQPPPLCMYDLCGYRGVKKGSINLDLRCFFQFFAFYVFWWARSAAKGG